MENIKEEKIEATEKKEWMQRIPHPRKQKIVKYLKLINSQKLTFG